MMLSIALLHYPCMDKNGEEVTTAITNLDLHDLARVCLTYGIDKLYIVHPYQVQRDFAEKIMSHWRTGYGGHYNPLRKKAFEVVRLAESIDEIKADDNPLIVVTSARGYNKTISWIELKKRINTENICLVFGTGWGLAESFLEKADAVVEPIDAGTGYNHLSVRSAVSIAIDRLLGR
ncbi:MAG TPA: RNA methyltransferase [Desulfomonilia bacterium]|jgi:hypothetical protein